jgi:hypothetical protein
MRRVDAALVGIAILLAAVWYFLRVAPSPPDPSAGLASPATLARRPSSAVASRAPRSGKDAGRSTGAAIAGAPGAAPPAELAAVMDVVHKHKMGSCRGRLSASSAGLRYEPTRPGDGFDVPRASIERLEADSRKNVLAVKLRGGRTYNFTDANGRAETLQAFQRAFAQAAVPRGRGELK